LLATILKYLIHTAVCVFTPAVEQCLVRIKSFLFISFVEEAASSVRRPISRSNYWRTGMAKAAMKTFALLTSEWNIFWSFGYGDQEACGQASDHGAGECAGRISHTKGPGRQGPGRVSHE
jgi:hypothetical protein